MEVLARGAVKLAAVAALMLALALPLGSCGAAVGFGVVVGDGYIDHHYGRHYFNGDRRGDYVYYFGSWYLYGIGTPYEYDPYWDPYIYY